MRLCLFALTGFGNSVVAALTQSTALSDLMVITRGETGEFPYYPCPHLSEVCREKKLTCSVDLNLNTKEALETIKAFQPEMIVVSTFDQKIPERIRVLPELGAINIHPSLLPKYRGPTPTHWAIINDETETGITFHCITENFDRGDILYQAKIPLDRWTDGEVRQKLAQRTGEIMETFLEGYRQARFRPRPQHQNGGSYFPKITSESGIALLRAGTYRQDNLIRGLTPYPGIQILGEDFSWATKVI